MPRRFEEGKRIWIRSRKDDEFFGSVRRSDLVAVLRASLAYRRRYAMRDFDWLAGRYMAVAAYELGEADSRIRQRHSNDSEPCDVRIFIAVALAWRRSRSHRDCSFDRVCATSCYSQHLCGDSWC